MFRWLLMGLAACGATSEGVTLSLVADEDAPLPPGTYVATLTVDGTPAQVAWTLAGNAPHADVVTSDGRRLVVTAAAPDSDRRRALWIGVIDRDGIVADPTEVTIALAIDGAAVAGAAYVVDGAELSLRVRAEDP